MTLNDAITMVEEAKASYATYAAEARACGYEVESFEEWAGHTSLRAEKDALWMERWENDTWDLY